MEAAWLAAVNWLSRSSFNVYSSRIFEPDKITLLRTLGLIILAAWIIKLIEQGGVRWEQIPHNGGGLKNNTTKPHPRPLIGRCWR